MGLVRAEIENVVNNLAKNVDFLQPLFEAIANSLESGSRNIVISLDEEEKLDENQIGLIKGFTIEDDGAGFTDKNIQGFATLWTKNKYYIGCKGSGRFLWLKVYKNVHVHSEVAESNTLCDFDFNMDFSSDSIVQKPSSNKILSNKTTMIFSGLLDEYKTKKKNGQLYADLADIKERIIDYLLVKFFLLKNDNINFRITLKNLIDEISITTDDIPSLKTRDYLIKGIDDVLASFSLLYRFSNDGKNSKKMCLCASNRSIKAYDGDDLGFSCNLPDNASFVMLVCSKYLDDRNSDDRESFDLLDSLKSANLLNPITISMIKKESINVMNSIIVEEYPNIEALNQAETESAIKEKPYLAPYIEANTDPIKSKKSLITAADAEYKKEKEGTKKVFSEMLESRNIDTKSFGEAVNKMSKIAAIELAEYIFYRDSIIDGLKKAIIDKATNEEMIHNIIMKKNTDGHNYDEEKLLNNIWLFDDKFMTYSYIASDKTIKRITEEMYPESETIVNGSKRPDIFIAFDSADDGIHKRNAVMIELKGPNADIDEKEKSLNELPKHIKIIRNNIPNIDYIWGYIITTIDDNFKQTLDIRDHMHPLFTKSDDSRAYYEFFEKINAHIYVLDLETIASDAKLRNSTFLEIIKQENK